MLNQFATEFRAVLTEYNVTDLNKFSAHQHRSTDDGGSTELYWFACID
jgi:hypothetical protein